MQIRFNQPATVQENAVKPEVPVVDITAVNPVNNTTEDDSISTDLSSKELEELRRMYNVTPEPVNVAATTPPEGVAQVTKPNVTNATKADELASKTEGGNANGESVTDVNNVEGGNFEFTDDSIYAFANALNAKGFVTEIPDDIDTGALTVDDIWKIIDHNTKLIEQKAHEKGVMDIQTHLETTLPDSALRILDYAIKNPNVRDEEILGFAENLIYTTQVGNLDPTLEDDARDIVRLFQQSIGETDADIEININDLAERGKLIAEAQKRHPMLISKLREKEAAIVKQAERQAALDKFRKDTLKKKIDSIVVTGKINDIQLTREDLGFVYNALLYDSADVLLDGGVKVKGHYLFNLIGEHLYGQDGDPQRVMLAALILKDGEKALEKYLGAKVKKEEVAKFVNASKQGSQPFKKVSPTTVDTGLTNNQNPLIKGLFKKS